MRWKEREVRASGGEFLRSDISGFKRGFLLRCISGIKQSRVGIFLEIAYLCHSNPLHPTDWLAYPLSLPRPPCPHAPHDTIKAGK